MKKKYIVGIVIALILLVIISFVIYNIIVEEGKKYEIAQIKQYNYFVLKQNNFSGVIDKKGNIVVNPEYDDIKIPNPEKAVFVCYKGEDTIVFNERKEEILSQYEKVEPIRLKNIASDLMYEKSVLKYVQDGKYGLIDFEGKQITKAVYDELDSLEYKEGELQVKQADRYGVINIKGNMLVEINYEKISVDGYYTDENKYKYAGYIVCIKTDQGYRYGYIDSKGKIIVQPEYNELSRITDIEDNENVYLLCAKNGQYGVNKNDNNIIGNEYQSIRYDHTNKLLIVEKSKKYGISNLEGKLLVPAQYDQIDIIGIYLYAENQQGITVYNSNGTQANIDAKVSILNTNNEKYKIRINNTEGTKYGVINKEGKQIIEEKYNYIEYLYDNYFIVSGDNGKLGVLDDKENEKVEIKYDSLQKIQNTDLLQASISQGSITDIYNKEMKKICEISNPIIEATDYIKIYNDEEYKYFDKDGKELKNTEIYSNNKLFAKIENGKWGFIDINGKIIVDYKYDKVTEFNNYGFASVQKDGKWGSINEQGQQVIEPTYELKDQLEPSFIGKYYKVTYGFGEFYYTDVK